LVGTVRDLGRYLEDTHTIGISTERILILQNRFKAILGGITPKNQYAATVASFLLTMTEFENIRQFLVENVGWSFAMERKLRLAQKHTLECAIIYA
jgi:hypothetical protein